MTGRLASPELLRRGLSARGHEKSREWPAQALAAGFACVAVALVAPLWLIELPPMPDFPAHAAAVFVQTHAAPGSLLSRFYEIDWAPVPDLASELIVPLFANIVSIITATKVFICMAVLLWVFGPAAVQYALSGRVTATSLAAAFFAYNSNFTMGFINFYFAAGVAFFVIAAWIATERVSLLPRFIMLAACFALLYFLHLLAVPFAGLVLLCFELAKLRRHDPDKTRIAIRNALIVCAA